MVSQIFLYIMSAFYIYAGINHFRKSWFYLKMMPLWIPQHKFFVDFTGIVEIILGIGLLFPQTRIWSAWGIIVLLIVVFPANIYMLTSGKFKKIPKWFLWLRLPLQAVLVWWAWLYTK